MKYVGLFFGSFNPIHIGHMAIAQYMLEYTPLDKIWFVVSPQNPFKTKETLYKHIGIYAYKKNTLLKLSELNEVQIEIEESLEQLRWTKNNYIIHCIPIAEDLVSINTIDDVKKVLKK